MAINISLEILDSLKYGEETRVILVVSQVEEAIKLGLFIGFSKLLGRTVHDTMGSVISGIRSHNSRARRLSSLGDRGIACSLLSILRLSVLLSVKFKLIVYTTSMSRYRLLPAKGQELALRRHCSDARYVWNMAVEKRKSYLAGDRSIPALTKAERYKELTSSRAENKWLAEGSQIVQQQALRDYEQALAMGFKKTHGFPTWRKAGKSEGFRVTKFETSDIRILNKTFAEVRVPKIGYVRFRYSKKIDFTMVRSFRVTLNPAGQWHVSFVRIPAPLSGPGTGEIIGIDVGVTHALALSNGEFYDFKTNLKLNDKIKGLQRAMARSVKDSNRRRVIRLRLAKAHLKKANKRKDWVEKTTTDIARKYDFIKIEDLRITNMTKSAKGSLLKPGRNVAQKSGLNREILDRSWGLIFTRLENKALGRVTRVDPRNTSVECNECGNVDKKNRESQAIFKCQRCGFTINADTNASITIRNKTAAGHAVAGNLKKVTRIARRGALASLKREPQVTLIT